MLIHLLLSILLWNPKLPQKTNPQLFEPNLISELDAWSFTPAFSKDGNRLLYVRWDNPNYNLGDRSIQRLYTSTKANGQWTEPVAIAETAGHRVDWPHFSPDGKHFLLSYNKYHAGQYNYPNEQKWSDFDIWRADCDTAGNIDWSSFEPIREADINREKTPANARIRYVYNETSPRMDLEGNLYFWSERPDQGIGRRDIYVAPASGSGVEDWQATQLLPRPINSTFRESGVAIAPDGQWMIFSSRRTGGQGKEDLYFSRKEGQNWTTPINLGPQVNSNEHDYCPQISPDGKTLYFTSSRKIKDVAPLDPGEGELVYNAIYFIPVDRIEAIQ
ncbi:MAG TPA: hypothetical protein VJ953_17090 [Saprospiraceae bacterium]|nr:hypothetical protein [Saprospiraceae bacterium]